MANSRQPAVLVVGSDFAGLVEALRQDGFRVDAAADGSAGLELFDSNKPDLVVLDVALPEMDGLQLCSILRARPVTEYIPILLIADAQDEKALDMAYQAGASDFATRPIDHLCLIYRLRHLHRLHRSIQVLRVSEKRLADAERIAGIGHWEWKVDSDVVEASDRLREIFEIPESSQVTYESFVAQVHPGDRELVVKAFERAIHEGQPFSLEHRIILPGGQERTVYQEGENRGDDLRKNHHLVGMVQDITKRKKAEQKVLRLAYYDNLTGLPNRAFFKEHLDYLLKIAKRYDRRVAILSFDLDLFKQINDRWGHSAGDRMLTEVGKRVTGCLRRSDFIARKLPPGYENVMATGGDAVVRLGGDEFIILLSEIRENGDAAVVAQRVLDNLVREPFVFEGQEVKVTSSIGISLYPLNGHDAEDLLKKADLALYSSKERGRNRYQFYSEELNAQALESSTMAKDLERALEEGEFVLYYQPRINTRSRQVTGAEALIRWEHPELGTILPQKFIPLAEEAGMELELVRWSVGMVCRQIRNWIDLGLSPFRVAVNLSARQFRHSRLAEVMSELLQERSLSNRSLEVELAEEILLDRRKAQREILEQLREMGLRISLDNFGTGCASLGLLQEYPIDSLKIDPVLVRDVGSDADRTAFVSAIIALAKPLRIGVIAKGVESQEQVMLLGKQGCDVVQGFFVSPPLSGEDFTCWLQSGPGLEAQSSSPKLTAS